MSVLPVYIYDQNILKHKAKPVRKVDEDLVRFTEDMFETMHNASGIGLAANQVGSQHRIVVIDVSDLEETQNVKPFVLLNPDVVEGEGSVIMEEGCLSLPDLREEVERPERVVVRYKDLEFKDQEIRAGGILARVLQHEIDHLNGVLFIDHLSALKRKLLRGRLNKMRKGEVEVDYPVVGGIPETSGTQVEKK